jgi:high-affinity nickel-transport protein
MPAIELLTTSSLGSLLGMRHALEPDHLAAVSTLVTGERGSRTAAWVGACWGVGHTATLFIAGTALVVLRAEMPSQADVVFEAAVVLLLIGFGVRAMLQALPRKTVARPPAPAVAQIQVGRIALARRPLLVGAVHGLAGSGALTAIVVAALPTTAARLAYLAVFGLGSIAGMAMMSGALGWPLARIGNRHASSRVISFSVGVLSTALGLYWGYPVLARLL